MHLRVSDPSALPDTRWSLTPLFCGFSVGLTALALFLVPFTHMAVVIAAALTTVYLLETTGFIRRIYRGWQSVMMMIASGQIGMCVGAWIEFGPLGLLTKYAICASLPGYGLDVVARTLSVAPLTHLGMFIGCVGAAVLIEPKLMQQKRKFMVLFAQTGLFLMIAIMVSKWASLINFAEPHQNYIVQILAMHLSMSLCMIMAGLLMRQNKRH